MPKKGRKKKIEEFEHECRKNRLKKAINEFFTAIDEDASGKLEPHEFVVAQAVVAEMAGDSFDSAEADKAWNDMMKFDKSRERFVDRDEFYKKVSAMCDLLPMSRDELTSSLACQANLVIKRTRREISRELRTFFSTLDEDGSGYLDELEIERLVRVAGKLSDGTPRAEEILSKLADVSSFEQHNQDGMVEVGEFVETFLEVLKELKVPTIHVVKEVKRLQHLAMQDRKTNPINKFQNADTRSSLYSCLQLPEINSARSINASTAAPQSSARSAASALSLPSIDEKRGREGANLPSAVLT